MTGNRIAPAPPDPVRVSGGGTALLLRRGGEAVALPAPRLRAACRCAGCAAARLRGEAVTVAPDIRLAAATPIGGYGLNLAFSDGHARGVFPFAYLDQLATEHGA